MNYETNDYATLKQQKAEGSGNVTASAEKLLDQGTEAYGKAEHAVCMAYDKSTRKVKETYVKAKTYSTENPGKTILIALGVGVGIGVLLKARPFYRSRTSRIAEPVVNALSEIAHRFSH